MTDIDLRDSITSRLTRPITLVGMMGSGKSTLGASLARLLGWHFYDTDRLIEHSAGKTIPEIFEQDGEAAFRSLERSTIQSLISSSEPCVIATGGGAITVPETAALIFNETLSVWIDASLDLLVSRTARQKNRPLLQNGDPRQILASLLETRGEIYAKATIHTQTDDIPISEVSERAMRQIHDYLLEEKA